MLGVIKKALITNVFIFIICLIGFAQSPKTYFCLYHSDSILSQPITRIKTKDSLSAHKEWLRHLIRLRLQGYLLAGADSVRLDSSQKMVNYNYYMYRGPLMLWKDIRPAHSPVWQELDLKPNKLTPSSKTGFNEASYRRFCYAALDDCADVGYPFAEMVFDSMTVDSNGLIGVFYPRPGPLITIDSILIRGGLVQKPEYLYSIAHLRPGDKYNFSKVMKVWQYLKRQPYAQITQLPEVRFAGRKATIYIEAKSRKANQADGILGILPNTTATTGSATPNRTLITGEFNLLLRNLFQSGKELKAEWKRFQTLSQTMNLSFMFPSVLRTGVDLKGGIGLLRQDTTYIDVHRSVSFGYSLGQHTYLSLNSAYRTSRLASTKRFQNATTLPQFADFNYYEYGFSLAYEGRDDPFIPFKGLYVHTEVAAGNKTILKNGSLNEELYNGLNLRTLQYKVTLRVEQYFRLTKTGILLIQGQGGLTENTGNSLFLNDLFRVGGLKTLRGANENQFFASAYGVGTVEFRQFFDAESYLFLFADQGYVLQQSRGLYYEEQPLGFGWGVSFSTKAGIFSLVYALGQNKTQAISLQQSKIHFGLVSRF